MIVMYFITGCTILASTSAVIEQWRSFVLTRKNWEELVAELQPTSLTEITVIALEYLNPGQTALKTEACTRLADLGGVNGIRQMWDNGQLLIALAGQAERWNPDMTRSLVTQMRRDGGALRQAAFLLSLHLLDHRRGWGALCIQRAASAYYQMAYRLLEAARQSPTLDAIALTRALWA